MKVTNCKKNRTRKSTKPGFTIVEVMLVVAIAGAMLIGLISGTFITIAQQRYNDALRSFAEYLRTMYSHAQSPESLGFGNSRRAILGKIVVFGLASDKVYSATLVGSDSLYISGANFLDELQASRVEIFCGEKDAAGSVISASTLEEYTTLWQSKLTPIGESGDATPFKGTLLITRTPTSGAIHTAFKASDDPYDLRDKCNPDNTAELNTKFQEDIEHHITDFEYTKPVQICVKSDDNAIVREVRIEPDARNTSGISLIQADSTENKCIK